MKTIVIYHSIDLDGWTSAAIVKKWFIKNNQNCKIIDYEDRHVRQTDTALHLLGYNYGQPIPDLSDYDKIIMCDVSFPTDEMLYLISEYGDEFIYIDHHAAKINEIYAGMSDAHILTIEGLQNTATDAKDKRAACELTWEYFFPNEEMPELVRLLGMYDSFRSKGTDEHEKVLEFQYGARAFMSNYEDCYERLGTDIDILSEQGRGIYQYLCTEAKQSYALGFPIEIGVHKFKCINKERFNPINFGIDYHKDGYDGILSFHITKDGGIELFNFSIYNDNEEVDCSIIAKQFGGGGHKGASGFRLSSEQFNNIILKNKYNGS